MKISKLLIATAFIFVSFLVLASQIWKTKTDESYVNFTARSTFGKVHGKIKGLQAEIKFDEKDLENSSFKAWVESGTLDTDNKKRDNHLKSPDFLDVAKYPSVKFDSRKISKTESASHLPLKIREVAEFSEGPSALTVGILM
jgi:polyisoprenoid-binding protein YceI